MNDCRYLYRLQHRVASRNLSATRHRVLAGAAVGIRLHQLVASPAAWKESLVYSSLASVVEGYGSGSGSFKR